MDKVALLEAVAECWNRHRLPYAVAHGLEAYPSCVGRDLDVVVSWRQARRAIDLAQGILEQSGLAVARPLGLWGERLVAASFDPEPDLLEIHAVERICWRFATLAADPISSTRLGPFAIDPWVHFAKRMLLPALAGETRKLRRELERYPLQALEAAAARRRLPAMVGQSLANSFEQALQECDEAAVGSLVGPLRRAITRRAWTRHPAAALGGLRRGLWRRVKQPFSLCGPVVCLVGPPGSGKTSLQLAICQGERLVFTRLVAVAWADRRLPAASHADHWVQLARHLARAVRRMVADRLHSSRQHVVVYEGCALDLDLSPGRFGLRSSVGARLCWHLLPQPDLILLLDVPPQVLCQRNPELSMEETAREYADWRARLRVIACGLVLTADRPVDELRRTAMRLIVEAFMRKNRFASSSTIEHARKSCSVPE